MLAAGWGGRGRPLPGAKPLDPSGPRAIRIPLGAPGAWPCTIRMPFGSPRRRTSRTRVLLSVQRGSCDRSLKPLKPMKDQYQAPKVEDWLAAPGSSACSDNAQQ